MNTTLTWLARVWLGSTGLVLAWVAWCGARDALYDWLESRRDDQVIADYEREFTGVSR